MTDEKPPFWRHAPWERPIAFHPLLAPLPSLLGFANANVDEVSPWHVAATCLAASGVAGLAWGALSLVTRDARSAALVVTLFALGFSAHGAVGVMAIPLWIVLVLGMVAAVAKGSSEVVTLFLDGVLVLGTVSGTFVFWNAGRGTHAPEPADVLAGWPSWDIPAGPRPDVWFLLLDGYGRADVLTEQYGVTDTLVPFLEERGFCVARQAHSNYAQTSLSLASSLNVDYLDSLLVGATPDGAWRQSLAVLAGDNRVVAAFDAAGYRVVTWPTEYSAARPWHADERRGPWFTMTEYEYHYAQATALPWFTSLTGQPPGRLSHMVRRRHVTAVLDDLAKGDRWDEPVFAYAHLLIPHPPFVFAADGSYRRSEMPAGLSDGSHWHAKAQGTGESYVEGYREQVTWLQRRLQVVIDGILAKSPDAVIVLHGDHGPGAHLDWESADGSDLRERMAILSAWRLPGGCDRVAPTITPINGWRLVLDDVLGADLPLLEDRVYYETWSRPFDFVDVTDRLRERDLAP